MREFKFRGWSNYNHTMKYFDRPEDMRCLVVMQSTGLKDMKGTPIFDGDIVISDSRCWGKHTCFIKYIEEYMAFCLITRLHCCLLANEVDISLLTIIGNVFETPEKFENQEVLRKEFGIK